MSDRLSWDEYFIAVADLIKARGSCPRKRVGAVIVDAHNQIIASGYNGAPKGRPHCTEVGCHLVDGHCTTAKHAEENALDQIRSHHREQALVGARIYVSTYPCDNCLRELAQHGIATVYYLDDYPNERTERIAAAWGIKLVQQPTRVQIAVADKPVVRPESVSPGSGSECAAHPE
ncbi:MAG TPA: dCMP deaminase family protein [Limnochordia bacterium]|nr:dCMP deaminase family protein [Limnochordia bacterium]